MHEDSDNSCILIPFSTHMKPKVLYSNEYECLLEIKSSSDLKIEFESLKIEEYWIAMESDYIKLSVKVIRWILLPFETSYLWLIGF